MHRFRVVSLALATTLLLALPAAADCPLGRFVAPPSYVHGAPLTVADFNHDGRLDTVTAFPEVSAIHVNLGGPGGTFERGPAIEIGSQLERLEVAFAATTADVDDDGNLDIVLAVQSSGAIEVHRGRGDGTFHPVRIVSYQAMPRSVATGDFDGDGILDIAAADPAARRIDVYWGRGDGTFVTPPTAVQVMAGRPVQLVVADFNGDGRADLSFGATLTGLEVRLAAAGRSFAQPHQLELAGGYHGSVIRDVDGDGELDIVVADLVADVISIFPGRGDGTFGQRVDYRAGSSTEGVGFGELTGDGIPDIVSGNAGAGTIVVLPGFGGGRFGPAVSYYAGYNVSGVTVADFNGDGRDDVLAADTVSYTVLLQGANRRLRQPDVFRANTTSFDVVTADFNSDGIPDVAVAAYEREGAIILLGNGDGTLRQGSLAVLGPQPVTLDVADLNGDGRSDLVAGLRGGISVALGRGNGHFHPPVLTPLDPILYLSGIGDFDNDGDVDAMALDRVENVIVFLANDGTGRLTEKRQVRTTRIPTRAILVDVNGDGRNDLVTLEDPVVNNFAELGFLVIRLGNGNGTFGSRRELPAGRTPSYLAAADFNNDGRLDLAVSDFTPNGGIHLYRGTGSGAFREVGVLPAYHQAGEPVLRDFDGDGDVDVAFTTTGLVMVYENLGVETLGNFTFADEPLAHVAGPGPWSSSSADFNGDGRIDLVTAGIDGHVSIQLNGTVCRRRSARH
ncbi:MAG TPA: VCBS repeat-containing protein [Thermoanaerobaculia bacterium]|jgi:hypothetical protein